MTLDEFVEKLKETPGPWELVDGRAIRCYGRCPIEAMAGAPAGEWCKAGINLGIRHGDINRITDSADLPDQDPDLRARLLAATVNR